MVVSSVDLTRSLSLSAVSEVTVQATISQCLDFYFFEDAVFLAECYFAESASDLSLYVLATSYYRAGQTMSAYKLLEKHGTRLPETRFLLARCCIDLNKTAEAELILTEIKSAQSSEIQHQYSRAFALALLAKIFRRSGREGQAMTAFKEAASYNPFLFSVAKELVAGHSPVQLRQKVPMQSANQDVIRTSFPPEIPVRRSKPQQPVNLPNPGTPSIAQNDSASDLGSFSMSHDFHPPTIEVKRKMQLLAETSGAVAPVLTGASTPAASGSALTPDVDDELPGVIGNIPEAPKKPTRLARRNPGLPAAVAVAGPSRGPSPTVDGGLLRRSTRLRATNENDQLSTTSSISSSGESLSQENRGGRILARPSNVPTAAAGRARTLGAVQQRRPGMRERTAIAQGQKRQRVTEMNRLNERKTAAIGNRQSSLAKPESGQPSAAGRCEKATQCLVRPPGPEAWAYGPRQGAMLDSFVETYTRCLEVEQVYQGYDVSAMLHLFAGGGMGERQAAIPPLLLKKALVHFEASEYLKAIDVFKELRLHAPHWTKGLEAYSTALWQLGREVELSALAQELTEDFPRAPESWCAAGNCFSYQKEHETAIKMFERAIQLCPDFAPAYTLLGSEYTEIYELEKAQQCFRAAARFDPSNYKAWFGIGSTYCKQGKVALAQYYYEKAMQRNRHNPLIVCHVCVMYIRQRKLQVAHRLLTAALKRSPNAVLCRYHLAECLIAMERYEEALTELDHLKQVVPRESRVYLLAGKVYKKLGKHHLALMNFSWATDLDPRGGTKHAASAGERMDDEPITVLATIEPDESHTGAVLESDESM